MKRGRSIIKKAVLAMFIVSTLSASAFAQSSGGVGGRPANPDPDNPRTQSIFIYTLPGGQSKTDQIFLNNAGDKAEDIEVYAVDGVVTNTGSYTCEQKTESRDGIGKWLKLTKNELKLDPKSNQLLDFTLTMPANADVGEHNGCIAIEKKQDEGVATGSVRVRTRQAVRVVAIVPGDIHRKVSIESFKASADINGQDYEVILKNEGNVSADVDISVRLRNVFGKEVYTNGGQYVSIRGEKLQLNFEGDFSPIFGGFYKAKTDIAYDKRAGTFGTQDTKNLLKSESKEIMIFVWPSPWLLAGLVVLLVGFVAFKVWRGKQTGVAKKRASRVLKKSSKQLMWGPYEARSGDTLSSLARKHGVTVEKLAVLNKLSSAATLKPGQRLYVPRKKK